MNYRKHGFTQKKPKEPGVYFISTDMNRSVNIPQREREKWEVAEVIYLAGSYTNVYENREDRAHWHIQTLGGVSYAWRPFCLTRQFTMPPRKPPHDPPHPPDPRCGWQIFSHQRST